MLILLESATENSCRYYEGSLILYWSDLFSGWSCLLNAVFIVYRITCSSLVLFLGL